MAEVNRRLLAVSLTNQEVSPPPWYHPTKDFFRLKTQLLPQLHRSQKEGEFPGFTMRTKQAPKFTVCSYFFDLWLSKPGDGTISPKEL